MTKLPLEQRDDVSSSSSSIPIWLDAHPDLPHHYECVDITTPKTTPTNAKKRGHVAEVDQARRGGYTLGYKRRKLQSNSGEASRLKGGKRRVLEAVIANPMAPEEPRSEQRLRKKQISEVQPPQQRSSRRRPNNQALETPRRTRSSHAPEVRDDGDGDDNDDEFPDEDPTPKALSWARAPVLPPPGSDTGSLNSSKSGSRVRSNSPSKRGDLQLSTIKVRILEGMTIPINGDTLWRDLRRIGKGFHILPLALRGKSIRELEDDPDDTDRYFDPTAKGKGKRVGDDGLDYKETWARVVEIHRAALDCRNKTLAEPDGIARCTQACSIWPCGGNGDQRVSGTVM